MTAEMDQPIAQLLTRYKITKVTRNLIILIATSIFILSLITTSYAQTNKNPKNSQNFNTTFTLAEEILSYIGTLGIGSIITLLVNSSLKKEELKIKRWERLIESLHWFEGRTQKRSIGIAIVESGWDVKKNKEFQSKWTSVLTNQAIYLLTKEEKEEKKEEEPFHEEQNLYRIINILIDKDFAAIQDNNHYRNQYKFLVAALRNHKQYRNHKKLKHINKRIKELGYKQKWEEAFQEDLDEKFWKGFWDDDEDDKETSPK